LVIQFVSKPVVPFAAPPAAGPEKSASGFAVMAISRLREFFYNRTP